MGQGSSVATSYSIGCSCSSDSTPGPKELPYVPGAAIKKKKKKKKKKRKAKYLKLRNLVVFYVWDIAKTGLTEILPSLYTSAVWGSVCVFTSSVSSERTFGSGWALSGGC